MSAANAEVIYADPSALARLYLHQTGSREMVAWRARNPGALPLTHHGRMEVVNAIAQGAFRGDLSAEKAVAAQGFLAEDFAAGQLRQVDILWRAALNRTAELSQVHTPKLGTRASDVLHVACALELKLKHFLTFDERQQKLAAACGLKPVKL